MTRNQSTTQSRTILSSSRLSNGLRRNPIDRWLHRWTTSAMTIAALCLIGGFSATASADYAADLKSSSCEYRDAVRCFRQAIYTNVGRSPYLCRLTTKLEVAANVLHGAACNPHDLDRLTCQYEDVRTAEYRLRASMDNCMLRDPVLAGHLEDMRCALDRTGRALRYLVNAAQVVPPPAAVVAPPTFGNHWQSRPAWPADPYADPRHPNLRDDRFINPNRIQDPRNAIPLPPPNAGVPTRPSRYDYLREDPRDRLNREMQLRYRSAYGAHPADLYRRSPGGIGNRSIGSDIGSQALSLLLRHMAR